MAKQKPIRANSGGTWIRWRAERPAHECSPPPIGDLDDLWRCDCGRLWRRAHRCGTCDTFGHGHVGACKPGDAWRPAYLSQRIRYWRRRAPRVGS